MMNVYKYLSKDRIDVLSNRMIRFTQYAALNDIFEFNHNITTFWTEDYIQEFIEEKFEMMVEKEFEKICNDNPIFQFLISKKQFIELAKQQKRLLKEKIISINPLLAKLSKGKISEVVNNMVGALSLSKRNDIQLMWSHYADDHRGFVIGFDCENPFFNQQKSPNDEFRHLRDIVYINSRPNINFMDTNGVELFYHKLDVWGYEEEVRMVLTFDDSAKKIDNEELKYPIYLFEFPAEAISEIIFGYRMSEDDKLLIKKILNEKYESSKIGIYQAKPDENLYSICIEKEND